MSHSSFSKGCSSGATSKRNHGQCQLAVLFSRLSESRSLPWSIIGQRSSGSQTVVREFLHAEVEISHTKRQGESGERRKKTVEIMDERSTRGELVGNVRWICGSEREYIWSIYVCFLGWDVKPRNLWK